MLPALSVHASSVRGASIRSDAGCPDFAPGRRDDGIQPAPREMSASRYIWAFAGTPPVKIFNLKQTDTALAGVLGKDGRRHLRDPARPTILRAPFMALALIFMTAFCPRPDQRSRFREKLPRSDTRLSERFAAPTRMNDWPVSS